MISYLRWAANAVLFVAACFLTANIANTIFAAVLAPPTAESTARSAPEADRTPPRWSDRQVILERNLFNSSKLDAATVAAVEDEEIEATSLPLQLLGTVGAEDPAYAWAAVLDLEARKTLVVTIGDLLKEKATVLRIERRRIVLLENGAHRELSIGDEDVLQTAASPSRSVPRPQLARARPTRPARRAGGSAVQKLAEDRFALPRADVEQVLRDPTDILSQARFLPRYEGEDMVGFQINSIKQDSVLREFGIADGDLITRFNGISITSPAESARLLQEFNESDSITLDVMRPNGDTDTIQVEMND